MQAYDLVYGTLIQGSWPNVLAKNASGPTATDGTPYTEEFINDLWGAREDLMNRASLVPNSITEAVGNSQFVEAFRRGAGMPPGIIIHSAANAARMAVCRFLPLEGQTIPIGGVYSELAAAVYVGDGLNPTAEAFYKCTSNGTRNTAGTYMVMPDARGLFLRNTGENSKYMMADDAPYDGKSIGAYLEDQFQSHYHSNFGALNTFWSPTAGGNGQSSFVMRDIQVNPFSDNNFTIGAPSSVPGAIVRDGPETSPASISALACITY